MIDFEDSGYLVPTRLLFLRLPLDGSAADERNTGRLRAKSSDGSVQLPVPPSSNQAPPSHEGGFKGTFALQNQQHSQDLVLK